MIERLRPKALIAALIAACLTLPAAGQQTMRLDAENSLMLREIGAIAAMEGDELRVITMLPTGEEDGGEAPGGASVRGGDTILMINGERTGDLAAARTVYDAVAVGDEVKLAVRRDDRPFMVSFTKQDAAELGQNRMVMRMAIGGDADAGEIRPILGLSIVAQITDTEVSVAATLPIGETTLAEGDVIRQIAGQELSSLDQLEELINAVEVGASLEVVVERGGERTVLEAVKQEARGRVRVQGGT